MPGASRSLLPPRLRATAANLRTSLRGSCPGPSRGQLRRHDLVHDRHLYLSTEDLVGEVALLSALAGTIDHPRLERHQLAFLP
jgi:hypothetical protein